MHHITKSGVGLLAAAAAAVLADSAAAGVPAAPEGVNLWTTESAQVDFSGFPIPAGFFGPGSDPFAGAVPLVGVPLDPGTLGSTDTIIRRGDVIFPGAGFPRPSGPVDIELVELSLTSVEPITVTGVQTELWFLDVDRSPVPLPTPGDLGAILETSGGGAYSAFLVVRPKFTFTKVGNPGDVRVLDTGLKGPAPEVLQHDGPFSIAQPAETPLDVEPNVACPTCPGTSNFWFGVDHAIGTLDLFQFAAPGMTLSLRTTPSPPPAPCPWDCQPVPNGLVDIADMFTLFGHWFAAGPCDFDGNALGDISDLFAMFGNWGVCP